MQKIVDFLLISWNGMVVVVSCNSLSKLYKDSETDVLERGKVEEEKVSIISSPFSQWEAYYFQVSFSISVSRFVQRNCCFRT